MVVKKKRLGSPGDHFPNMLSNLSKLQTRDKFTDVVFHCDGGSVGAHKAFLGPLSPLLSNMFEISTRFQARRIKRREKPFLSQGVDHLSLSLSAVTLLIYPIFMPNILL